MSGLLGVTKEKALFALDLLYNFGEKMATDDCPVVQ